MSFKRSYDLFCVLRIYELVCARCHCNYRESCRGVQEKMETKQALGLWTVIAPELDDRYSNVMTLGSLSCSGWVFQL